MKKNAQKLMLCLYSFDSSKQVVLPIKVLRQVIPDMSEGGFRSLLLFLERKKWLSKESIAGTLYISLSNHGKEALRLKFPALNDKWVAWQGEWQALVFIKAPESDQQFRYLRQQLVAHQTLPLSRGVYLAAGGFSPDVLELCRTLYQDSVVIFSVGEWQHGLDRPIVTNYYDLASTASLLSSISGDISLLLGKINSKKSSSNQTNLHISTVIDRLCDCLGEDPGFTKFYFPGVLDIRSILPKLQQLLQL